MEEIESSVFSRGIWYCVTCDVDHLSAESIHIAQRILAKIPPVRRRQRHRRLSRSRQYSRPDMQSINFQANDKTEVTCKSLLIIVFCDALAVVVNKICFFLLKLCQILRLL